MREHEIGKRTLLAHMRKNGNSSAGGIYKAPEYTN